MKGVGDGEDLAHRDVSVAALDVAHVAAVDARQRRESLLADALSFPDLSDASTQIPYPLVRHCPPPKGQDYQQRPKIGPRLLIPLFLDPRTICLILHVPESLTT